MLRHWQMFKPTAKNYIHHAMVSRVRITYLKYDFQFGENEPERS